MKRPDEFELFAQRRKRQPLAEIRGGNLKNRSFGTKTERCMGKRPDELIKDGRTNADELGGHMSGRSTEKNVLCRAEKRGSGPTGNRENIVPPYGRPAASCNSKSTKPGADFEKRSIFDQKQIFNSFKNSESHRSTVPTSSAIPLTSLGQIFSSKAAQPPKKPENHLSKLSAKSWANAKLSEPSARYRLLQSLVDYDTPVGKSNQVIRSFCAKTKLGESSSSRDLSNGSTLEKLSRISPFLLAATLADGEEILLMNTQETDVVAGSKVRLEKHYVYTLGGLPKKAYYKWQIV